MDIFLDCSTSKQQSYQSYFRKRRLHNQAVHSKDIGGALEDLSLFKRGAADKE